MNKIINCNGEWLFKEVGTERWENARVPGCVQQDLIRVNQLPDPYYRNQEHQFYSLEKKDWLYKKEFEIKENIGDYDQVNLVFEGIDTIAEVYLNNNLIGKTRNMFRSYSFDISNFLIKGKNEIQVYIKSPIKEARKIKNDDNKEIKTTGSEGIRPYIRKAQYSFGWDWGPRLMQTGIFRPVYIEFISNVSLADLFVYTEMITEDKAIIKAEALLNNFKVNEVIVEVAVQKNKQVITKTVADILPAENGKKIKATLELEDPQLWYPRGIGDQPLYDINFTVYINGKPVTEEKVTTGIRKIKLLQEKDELGESFIIEVNGEKIFAKGANWIPGDNFLTDMTADKYKQYVTMAAEANMNILRVWGGGIYEDKVFYEACDRKGIMVWQDFMYACAEYPDHYSWFKEEARMEAIEQVRRLRNHPSIVLWCGNNEVNWLFGEGNEGSVYGDKIFKEILPGVCTSEDPSRPYWTSSPYSRGSNPNSKKEGNRHNWQVWSMWQDYDYYREDTSRFVSEFGFQAMPTWETVLSYTEEEDRHILSQVNLGHNKMVEGTERLLKFMIRYLGFPADYRSFVYLSQFNQAEAVKTAVEHWRSRKYKTAGAIYWQLNDCWPVASWSSIDYKKRKKALYHYSRKFYAPILPIIKNRDDKIKILIDNEFRESKEAEVELKAYSLKGDLLSVKKFETRLLPDTVNEVGLYTPADFGIGYLPRVLMVEDRSTTYQQKTNGLLKDTVLYLVVRVDGVEYENYMVFDKFRNLNIEDPEIRVEFEGDKIKLTADKPAFAVFIESSNDKKSLYPDNNCLNMIPDKEYNIEVENRMEVDIYNLYTMGQKIF